MPNASRYAREGGRLNRVTITRLTLRSWLRRLRLSQQEAARQLYVDPRTMRAWALGERSVSGPAIKALELMLEGRNR